MRFYVKRFRSTCLLCLVSCLLVCQIASAQVNRVTTESRRPTDFLEQQWRIEIPYRRYMSGRGCVKAGGGSEGRCRTGAAALTLAGEPLAGRTGRSLVEDCANLVGRARVERAYFGIWRKPCSTAELSAMNRSSTFY